MKSKIFCLVSVFLLSGLLTVTLGSRVAQAEPFAYVTGQRSVFKIDTATNSIVDNILLAPGSRPFGVAITPDGSRVYVTQSGTDNVAAIDTATGAVTTIPVGTLPRGIAITPDPRAYVMNESSARPTISVIDTATDAVVDTIFLQPAGSQPLGVAITPDGSRAYVARSGRRTVSVIDTTTNTVIADVVLPPGDIPDQLAITPDGSRVYVTQESSRTISVIDTATNTVVAQVFEVGDFARSIAITPDGSRAYVPLFNQTAAVIDTAINRVVDRVFDLGFNPQGIAITPDGSRAYVANLGSSNVSVIDTAINRVVDTVSGTQSPQRVAITPVSDLAISKVASPDPVMPGADLTYTIIVTNNGPSIAKSVTVTDVLPDTTTFVSCDATADGVCDGTDNSQTISFASLATGESATITLVARVNDNLEEGTIISNTATVSSPVFDPDESNNSATVDVTVSLNPPARHRISSGANEPLSGG